MAKIPFFSVASVLCWITLLIGTLTPGDELPELVFRLYDKLLHFGVFLVFTSLTLIAVHREKFLWSGRRNWLNVAVVVAVITSVATEGLQLFVPGRFMSFADLLANMIGVLGGYGLFKVWVVLFGRTSP